MNHIYKTIFNKSTGEIKVTSEHASSHSRSQTISAQTTQSKALKSIYSHSQTILAYTIGLILSMNSMTSSATDYTYTGTASELITSDDNSISGNFNQLIGSNVAKGIMQQNNQSNVTIRSLS